MTRALEDAVARHYAVPDLARRILDGLTAAGFDPERPTPEQLAPVDEFHIGGRAATVHAVAKLGLAGGELVLDVGCGIGGTTRYLASVLGCRVTGIDLTPEYVETARLLAERTGLAEAVGYKCASALDMPFEAASFDAATSFHAAMNIAERAGLYREIARVLRPGAGFCLYDVMQGPGEGLRFPVPWAESPATSHLTTPEETAALLTEAGFDVEESEDRSAFGIAFFRERLAAGSGPPPLGLHLLTGPSLRDKLANLLAGLEAGAVVAGVLTARRKPVHL